MQDKKPRFLNEVIEATELDRKGVDRNIRSLKKRGYLTFKQKLLKVGNISKLNNLYLITNEGIDVLNVQLKAQPFEVSQIKEQILRQKGTNPELMKRNKEYIGKTQKLILQQIRESKVITIKDLEILNESKRNKFYAAAGRLFERGYLKKKKNW